MRWDGGWDEEGRSRGWSRAIYLWWYIWRESDMRLEGDAVLSD